jgi:hypothetical protein
MARPVALAVAGAAAVAVGPVVLTSLVAPAWADRSPFAAQSRTAGVAGATSKTGTSSAGSIGTPSLTGPARLQTRSTLTASADVVVPRRSRAQITLTTSGRRCSRTAEVPRGRTTVRVGCVVTLTARQIPALPARVDLTLYRVDAGVPRRTARTAERSIAVDDGAPVSAARAEQRWRRLAADLHAEAGPMSQTVAAKTSPSIYGSANLASAVWRQAQASGWSSPATRALIADLLATRKAGGGYGLSTAWDAYSDGTLNPAGTTYTVTTAGHVGWLLLEAHKNRALPADGLTSAVDAMLAMPRLNGGTCFAYSDSRQDAEAPCVYNVTHGAAAFLVQVRRLTDYRAAEVDRVLLSLRSRLTDGYNPATGYWSYMSSTTVAQDMSHQVYTAKSVDVVQPSFGAVDRMMALPWWRHPGGLRQSRAALASAMMDVAKECRYARSPAVLLAVERAQRSGAPSFTVLGMAAVADEIVASCFD